jgi:hypothetical protein
LAVERLHWVLKELQGDGAAQFDGTVHRLCDILELRNLARSRGALELRRRRHHCEALADGLSDRGLVVHPGWCSRSGTFVWQLDDSLLLRVPRRSERDPLVGPRSSDYDSTLPIELVEIEEELVAPVSAKADDVALVNHERHIRVFDGRRHACDVSPHVLHGVYVETRKAIELLVIAVAERSDGFLGGSDRHFSSFFLRFFQPIVVAGHG